VVPAIWPEANLDGIASEQERVDAGADAWRTDPLETAREFVRTVIGWQDVALDVVAGDSTRGSAAVHAVNNETFETERFGAVIVVLSQVGRRGAGGIWSVTDVPWWDTRDADGGAGVHLTCDAPLVRHEAAMLCGTSVDRAGLIRYAIHSGDGFDLTVFDSASVYGTGMRVDPQTGEFSTGITEQVPDDATVLAVEQVNGGVVTFAAFQRVRRSGGSDTPATTVPEQTTSPDPTPSSGGITEQPPLTDQAADTRAAILDAARANDYEQLRPLIEGPFTFSSGDIDERSDVAARAISRWKGDGFEPLRVMAALLEMPYTTVPSEDGVIDVWPALYNWTPGELRKIDEVAPEWRSAMQQLYPDFEQQLQDWIDFGGYLGWRIGIREDGHWQFFVAGD
jgi:hypothetical protein